MIGGLRVNVSHEAILQREEGNELWIGGIKFYLSKSKKLGKQRADYAGAIMNWYCEKHLSKLSNADYRCSLLVDLPGDTIHTAPKAKVRNRSNIEAACEEIFAMWPD